MLAALILSIVTGDSNIREGVRVAEITTSCPRTLAGFKMMDRSVEALVAITSCASKPMEDTSKVTGNGPLTFKEKFPLSSVYVPAPDPLTVIETAGIDSLLLLFCTFPLIVLL